MKTSPLAGKPAEPSMLVNLPKRVTAYCTDAPDPSVPGQRVAFGASGHRGSAFKKAFNGTPIGGLKVIAGSGWFAARPSGTQDIYKIYAESFCGTDHLRRNLGKAQAISVLRWQRLHRRRGLRPRQV